MHYQWQTKFDELPVRDCFFILIGVGFITKGTEEMWHYFVVVFLLSRLVFDGRIDVPTSTVVEGTEGRQRPPSLPVVA